MGSGPIDPKELLKGLDCFLGRDGEVKTMDGISKIFSLMKDSQKMVSRCIYLNILLQTRAQDILNKFIRIGGYKLLNTWLTGSKAANNVPFLQQLLLTLQHLPLTVDHLKQNNTAKLVKQLSKSSDDEELRRLASILVSDWMGVIRSQSSSQPTERDKKKRKEENKSKTPVPEKPQETKNEAKNEEIPEKKREKPKSLRTTAPSHAKFRSTGLELETPSLVPVKKLNSASSDKYSLKPVPVKRQSAPTAPGEAPLAEKKYKPLNTAPNAAKEIKVKIIPPQPMEGLGFLDALNSAPVPGIKIKKKKKVLSPTAAKPSPFEGKPAPEPSTAKPSSPEPAAAEPMDTERPGTPVPAIEVPEPMDTGTNWGSASGQLAPFPPSFSFFPSFFPFLTLHPFISSSLSLVSPHFCLVFALFSHFFILSPWFCLIYPLLSHIPPFSLNFAFFSHFVLIFSHFPPFPLFPPILSFVLFFPPFSTIFLISPPFFSFFLILPHFPLVYLIFSHFPPISPPVFPNFSYFPPILCHFSPIFPLVFPIFSHFLLIFPLVFPNFSYFPPILCHFPSSFSHFFSFSPRFSPQGGPSSHKAEELLKQPDYSDKIKHLLGNLGNQPPGGPGGGEGHLGTPWAHPGDAVLASPRGFWGARGWGTELGTHLGTVQCP
uniref:Protein phosphatase 1 regulatory subunit 10 n=1 Tax=Serinus canaria TaxID=9135 RepID=A0A8C9MYT4_SERCA